MDSNVTYTPGKRCFVYCGPDRCTCVPPAEQMRAQQHAEALECKKLGHDWMRVDAIRPGLVGFCRRCGKPKVTPAYL